MHQNKTIIFTIFLLCHLAVAGVSIRDIQYTTIAGEDNNFPSLYNGQIVETGGIVSGVDFDSRSYFLNTSNCGAWSGIFIYDAYHSPEIGDSVILTGRVYEYKGTTELKDIQSFETISKGNIFSNIPNLSTQEVSTEAYENCLGQISNFTVTQTVDSWNEWRVDDGSGECIIGDGFFNLENSGFSVEIGETMAKMAGIISYTYGNFQLNPRKIDDIQFGESGYIVTVQPQIIYDKTAITIPIVISSTLSAQSINNVQLNFHYNPEIINYTGFSTIGTLFEDGLITEQKNDQEIQLDLEGSCELSGSDILLFLDFGVLSEGDAGIVLDTCVINEADNAYLSSGNITILKSDPIGDTLTVIQKPIMNIPEIITPGETMEILCLADEATFNWRVELVYNVLSLELPIASRTFDNESNLWIIEVLIPEPELYELYDLHVTASGNIDDITENAVNLIKREKDEYYFIQITDTHLPTHTFFSNNEFEALNDTSGLQYFREVINDINIINPEFVLITGDLINEGELEDFRYGRVYTKSQKLLTELNVPFYLVGGNHDLGGWDATPPSQGTSRRDWWRFFGWKWLQDGDVHTQDYTFTYGDTKFIGLESYDNYDAYMYNIYGNESFTQDQMDWLQTELANSTEFSTKVLFYHYDFSNQINLSSLNVDGALYGHIHRDSGDESARPFNLATDNVCDGTRAYRVIKMENAIPNPLPTLYVNEGEETIDIAYSPSNNGSANSVTARLTNRHAVDFEHAKIKFIMPKTNNNYSVSQGTITQIDSSGGFDVCYVEVNLPANSELSITINATGSTGLTKEPTTPNNFLSCYPNPFNSSTTIEYAIGQQSSVELSIYNINGQKVRTLVNEVKDKGKYQVSWRGYSDDSSMVSAGVYFYEIISENFSSRKQMVFLK